MSTPVRSDFKIRRSTVSGFSVIWVVLLSMFFVSCKQKAVPNGYMVDLLKSAEENDYNPDNIFSPGAIVNSCDSIINHSSDKGSISQATSRKANALLQLGKEQEAIDIYEQLLRNISVGNPDEKQAVLKGMANAYLRMGERINCIGHHSAESCIYPISNGGVHQDKTGSEKAIEIYTAILLSDPGDIESKWLLNIAYMTTGGYPQQVPPQFLLKVPDNDSTHLITPFRDVAANIGINDKHIAGGCIIDDFNNDNYPDIILSSWSLSETMKYYRNNANGTFTDASDSSGLGYLTGGLHIEQTDYNNDGFKDIFVLRGGWKGKFGQNPNSLLRNNGNGTFTDVTKDCGLLGFHPSQTAVWRDFNNDGWLDVFIGNETSPGEQSHPCQLFMNNKNGSFSEIGVQAGCAITAYVKGVTSGDYDNDGLSDIFISTMNGKKVLLKNKSVKNGSIQFENVTKEAGLSNNLTRTFPTWFWDYNNDGWLDIVVCGYEFTQSLSYYAGAESVQLPVGNAGKVFLFSNKQDGTFEDVTAKVGLNQIAFAMGANFGDIDNDGFLDFYLGTGNPQLRSAVPNKLFKNVNGTRFLDVTTSARVGNLQKGHAVSFADLDNDGDEDIYVKMGGAYTADAYENSLYLNPGQNRNHWLNLSLEGVVSNKLAIGARIKVTFKENNLARAVFRDVNSGASFGSNPLQQHIGLGKATTIEALEITWPTTGKVQIFKNLPVDKNIKIKEANDQYATYQLARFDFIANHSSLIECAPN